MSHLIGVPTVVPWKWKEVVRRAKEAAKNIPSEGMPAAQFIETTMSDVDPLVGPELCRRLARKQIISLRKIGGVSFVFAHYSRPGRAKQPRPDKALNAIRSSIAKIYDIAKLLPNLEDKDRGSRGIALAMAFEAISELEQSLLKSGAVATDVLDAFSTLWPDMAKRIRQIHEGFLLCRTTDVRKRSRRPNGMNVLDLLLDIIRSGGHMGVSPTEIRAKLGGENRKNVAELLEMLSDTGLAYPYECIAPGRRLGTRWFAVEFSPNFDSQNQIIVPAEIPSAGAAAH